MTDPVIRGNSLYTLVNGPTWTQAEANAQKLGGHLTAITSSEENTFIGSNFYQYKSASSDSPTFWIGATDSQVEGQWKWVSGEPFDYNNFNQGTNNRIGVYPTYDPVYTSSQYWLGNQDFDPNGEEIHIEVKSITLPGQKFKLTNNEIGVAQEKQKKFYIAVVRQTDDFFEIAMISDPIKNLVLNEKIKRYRKLYFKKSP
jgi:hypothetical protein